MPWILVGWEANMGGLRTRIGLACSSFDLDSFPFVQSRRGPIHGMANERAPLNRGGRILNLAVTR